MPKVSEAIAVPLYLLCEAQLLTLPAPLPKGLIMYFSIPHRQLPGLIFTIHSKHFPDMLDGCAHAEKRIFFGILRLGLGGWVAGAPLFPFNIIHLAVKN